jgi:hypothetical protein
MNSPKRPTVPRIAYWLLLGVGIILILFGAIVAAFGLGNPTVLDLKYDKLTIHTTSGGLALVVLGGAFDLAIAVLVRAETGIGASIGTRAWGIVPASAAVSIAGAVLFLAAIGAGK